MGNNNIFFSGTPDGLSYELFESAIKMLYGEPTKIDLLNHLGGPALEYFLKINNKPHLVTTSEILVLIRGVFKVSVNDKLGELLSISTNKYNNLEELIYRFNAVLDNQDRSKEVSSTSLISIFVKASGKVLEELGEVINTVDEAIQLARIIESKHIENKGISLYNGSIIEGGRIERQKSNVIKYGALTTVLFVNDHLVRGSLASGLPFSSMWKSIADEINLDYKKSKPSKLRDHITGAETPTIGSGIAIINFGDSDLQVEFHVVKDKDTVRECFFGSTTYRALSATLDQDRGLIYNSRVSGAYAELVTME